MSPRCMSCRVRGLTLAALCLAALPADARAQSKPRAGAPLVANRGAVHSDTFWAQSLGIRKVLTVYLPPSYATSRARRYPVLVYLHGLTGSERNWVDNGALDRTLDSLVAAGQPEAIVVMPDGDDGWYTTWNSLVTAAQCAADTSRREAVEQYCVPWPHYDDYIARDIVSHVDAHYRTLPDRAHRGIAGLSMGGLGAMSLALAYPAVFGAAASHSGVLSPRLLGPKPWAPPSVYATDSIGLRATTPWLWKWMAPVFGRDTIGWIARDPVRMAARASRTAAAGGPALPALRIDCGVDDSFIEQNRDFHATLLRLGVSHEYAEWPGKHDWVYWRAHAVESIVFLLAHTRTETP